MVVLADEVLESFFDSDLSNSFKLEPVPDLEPPTSANGLLGDLWSTIATDSNKKIFNMFTDEIGKTIGKHQVSLCHPTLPTWSPAADRLICRSFNAHLSAGTLSWKSPKPANRFLRHLCESHHPRQALLILQVPRPRLRSVILHLPVLLLIPQRNRSSLFRSSLKLRPSHLWSKPPMLA